VTRLTAFMQKNPFVLLTFLVIAGYILAENFEFKISAFWYILPVLLFVLNLYLYLKYDKKIVTSLVLFASITIASIQYYNYDQFLLPDNHLVLYNDINQIEGEVIKSGISNKKDKYTIKVNKLIKDNSVIQVNGNILLTTSGITKKFQYGDVINISGSIKRTQNQRNPGQFNYRKYLESKDIYHIVYITNEADLKLVKTGTGNRMYSKVILPGKDYLISSIDNLMNDDCAGLMKALIAGEKGDLNPDIIRDFRNVGIIHVLAVSGLHVGFIIIFLFSIISFFRLSLKIKLYILIIFLFVYAAIIDFKPPVVRASMMASIYMFALANERKVSVINIIAATALILLLFNPDLLFDPGFQFSFFAVLSIIIGFKKLNTSLPLKKYLINRNYNKKIVDLLNKLIWLPFLISISATLGTLPLTVYYYGMIPLLAIVVNVFAIPIIGILLFAGIFMIIFSIFSSFLAMGLARIISFIFSLLKDIIHFLSELSFSHINYSISSVWVIIGMYIFLLFLFYTDYKKIRVYLISCIILITVFFLITSKINKNLCISFLDVGQGDAIMIRFPNGKSMLVDGGPTKSDQYVIKPYLRQQNISSLDYVVITHPHNDHLGGICQLIHDFPVDTIITSKYNYDSKSYKSFLHDINMLDIPVKYIERGDVLKPDNSVRLYILHPGKNNIITNNYSGHECNNSSVVMKLQYGVNGILLTGDIEKSAEITLYNYGDFLESEILKIAHHGSNTSTSDKLLSMVQPLAAVIPVAEKNRFNHPSPVVMSKLSAMSINTLTTKRYGAIILEFTTEDVFIKNWR